MKLRELLPYVAVTVVAIASNMGMMSQFSSFINEGSLRQLYQLNDETTGAIPIELRPLSPLPDPPVEVALLPLPVDRDDFRLRHKTSDRLFYDEARAAAQRRIP